MEQEKSMASATPPPPPSGLDNDSGSGKRRSLSDPPTATTLAPSPEFKERRQRSIDDHALLPNTPRPPRRSDLLSRLTLQLQLPPSPVALPLSPTLDSHNIFMSSSSHSPATSLPRHSRGLDFSRASTTLHHSTLANTPDSSPVIMQKSMPIPVAPDSPHLGGHGWGTAPQERSTLSSSVGSVNMMASDSDSSDSEGDASMGGDDNNDDLMLHTPQVHKLQNPTASTPFAAPATPGQSTWGLGSHFSPAQASLMKTIRRTRLHKNGGKGRSRKSSSSASGSGYSSMASPRTTSPPPMRSIETTGGGYFSSTTAARGRRESLAMGTDGLHLSSGNDSGDEAQLTAPSTPGVVRRPVVRRGNLLPKTKGFARIRAALMEESAPVDTETRREAETIRQVRERDTSTAELELPQDRPQTSTAASSPNLLPAVPESAQEHFERDLDMESATIRGLGLGAKFAEHATRNSGGLDYWNRFDPTMRTPPPPPAGFHRQSSSMISDVNMDSPVGDFTTWRRPRARSSASDASEAFQTSGTVVAISDDMHLQKFKQKRRRDAQEDEFDIGTIKRRAVSPGMSTAQNSPVLANSPSARDSFNLWGQPPDRRDKAISTSSEPISQSQCHNGRQGSIGGGTSATGLGSLVSQGKKLGLQPMADTNDGLMKMSIE